MCRVRGHAPSDRDGHRHRAKRLIYTACCYKLALHQRLSGSPELAVWSIGSQIALPLFEGGLRRAELDFAKSAYAQTSDSYRSGVLAAFQQVEDELSLNGLLAKEAVEDRQVASAAGQAQSLSMQLCTAGVGNFLDVVVAQVSALQAQTGQIGIDVRLQQASVDLVRALGGGWSAAELPTEKQIQPFNPLVPG